MEVIMKEMFQMERDKDMELILARITVIKETGQMMRNMEKQMK